MRVALLVSPSAEAGSAGVGERARVRLVAAGVEVVAVAAPSADRIAPDLTAAVAGGADRVVILGGDGTIHRALPALAATGVPVGLVPVGTGNDFARGLGIRAAAGVDAAVDRALGEPVAVDLARTAHGWFASVATCGFSADVNERANAMRRPRGELRYTIATVLEVRHLRPVPLHIELDDRTLDVDAAFVAVGNTPYFGGGMAICDGATTHDGTLDLTVIGDTGRLEMLRFLPTVSKGLPTGHPKVSTYRSTRVAISERSPGVRPRDLWADGEPTGPLPVEIECVPGTLLVAGLGSAAPA